MARLLKCNHVTTATANIKDVWKAVVRTDRIPAAQVLKCNSLSTRWQHRTANSSVSCCVSMSYIHTLFMHRAKGHTNTNTITIYTNAQISFSDKSNTVFMFKHVKTSLAQCTESFKLLHLMICHGIWVAFAESAVLCSSKGRECSVNKLQKRENKTLLSVDR